MTINYNSFDNAAATSTTNFSWTAAPSGTPTGRGIVVTIVQNGSTSDQVSSVTYGGVSMARKAFQDNAGQAGAVYVYFLGSGVPSGSQTVSVTVSGSASKYGGSVHLNSTTSDVYVDAVTASDLGSVTNPSISLGTVSEGGVWIGGVLHTAEGTPGDLGVGSGFSQLYEVDFGAEIGAASRRTSIYTGTGPVTVDWTNSVAEFSAIAAISVRESVIYKTIEIATETDTSQTLTGYKTLAISQAAETDLSRNMANVFVPRVTETDTSRTVTPLTASWPAFNGTRTFIPLTTSTIDSTLSGAASGTVFVLTNQPRPTSAGVTGYSWTSSLPAGVTIRGNPIDATGQSFARIPLVTLDSVTVGDDCTLRDMWAFGALSTGFSFSGKAWFENCVLGNTIADAPPSSADDYVVFSRCTLHATGDIPLFDDDGVAAGAYYFYDCVFLDKRTSGTSPLIKTFAGDITFVNCTFGETLTDWISADPGATGSVSFTNCVFAGEITDVTTPGSVAGSSNWGVASPAVSIGQTTVTNLYLNTDGAYWGLTPTNQSPFRAGGTTMARAHAGAMTLDRNYLPYAASSPSAGAFQWRAASSCLYKARGTDPLDGLEFVYGVNTLDTTYFAEFDTTLLKSHLDVAAVVRSYVWDLIHPSRGYFYTTWDGYYRLFLHAGQFDLTISSPASKIFGTTTLTAEEDTG